MVALGSPAVLPGISSKALATSAGLSAEHRWPAAVLQLVPHVAMAATLARPT